MRNTHVSEMESSESDTESMSKSRFLPRGAFQGLLDVLRREGYRCVGPQVRDGAIVYDDLESVAQLPHGTLQHQEPGSYRLENDGGPRCFAWANGPQALKPYLFTPRESLWTVTRDADGRLAFRATPPRPQALAFIGARACDIAALRLQDAHFLGSKTPDTAYSARRDGLLLIAVNCMHPADTCFCHSTGDGPRVPDDGADIVLSELDEGFVITDGSERGAAVVDQLATVSVTDAQVHHADDQIAAAAVQQRRLPSGNLNTLLKERLEHPRWHAVAERCLSCGNCTSVCPSCFCSGEQDVPTLTGEASTHERSWDSCFTRAHSYIHGHVVHAGTRERYRQWLTHKLATWHDQYGRSGCVGCGRCISWCPVGIDLTNEVAEITGGSQ